LPVDWQQWIGDRAKPAGGHVDGRRFCPIRQLDRDDIARANAARRQVCCQDIHHFGHLAITQATAKGVDYSNLVGMTGNRGIKEFDQ